MITPTIHNRVITKITDGIKVAEQHYGIKIPVPNVIYQKRGTTAGTANYRSWEIDLNAGLLVQNVDDFIDRTVPHELAHLIHHITHPADHNRFYGKRDVHGYNWQSVMRVLGAEPSRCHSYDVSAVKQVKTMTRHIHTCNTCGTAVEIGPKHHTEIQRGGSIYHKPCGRNSRFMATSHTVVKTNTGVDVPVTPNKPSTPTNSPAKGSKIHSCYDLYKQFGSRYSRSQMINIFVQNCDCTPAGASTYYQTCKKMYESGVL
jgi:SprT protein